MKSEFDKLSITYFSMSYLLMLISVSVPYPRGEEIHLQYTKDVETLGEELHGLSTTTVHIRTKQAAEKLKRAVGSSVPAMGTELTLI